MPAKEPKRTTTTATRKPAKAATTPTAPTLVAETPEARPPRRPAAKRTPLMPTHDQIRERAFSIFLKRNGGPGDPHSDWLEAERQLTAELNG
jgi:hypothetical protein